LVGVLIVVAAATRSAQVPAHGWLIGTVWAPTPVSALLHAGVVNAGGILAIRLWGLVGATAVVTHLLLLLGTLTLVVGTLQARARSDVKGSLAASTVAQMGFMTLTVAVGAHAAALLHLVAHGMFKASLFLGSGSAVSTARRARQHPRADAPPSLPWRAAAVGVPVAVVGAAAVYEASYGILVADVLLATVLGAAAVAIAGSGLHRTRSAGLRVSVLVGAGSVGAAYLILAHAVDAALASDLPAPGAMVPGLAWLAVVAAAAGITAAVVRGLGGRRARSAQVALYGALVVPRITEAPVLTLTPAVTVRPTETAVPSPDATPAPLASAVGAHSSAQPLGAQS
jgi:NADH:ubiquinone oxidoreductase subunit 5 (subunit L)/multisubunit Na+/H+ antiporter MnhA subunit